MKVKLSFLFFLTVLGLSAQMKLKIDKVFDEFEKYNKGMFSISVSRDGKPEYFRTVGMSDLEAEKIANQHTKYRIASITKVFTGILVFKAIEEGKLKNNTKVSDFFPQIKNAKDITIDNLLNHTSGIKNISELKNFPKFQGRNFSREEFVELINQLPSDFPPGLSYSYSNTGYSVLAFILEKVYNKSFGELISEKITIPLQMNDTQIGNNEVLTNNNEAKSYRYFGDWRKSDDASLSLFYGSANIISTSQDLNIFFTALFSGKLISEKNLTQMKYLTKGLQKYGYEEYNAYGHTGSMTGFLSFSLYFPVEKLSISITQNGVRYQIGDIMEYLAKDFLNKNYEIPDFSTVDVSAEELSSYEGKYKYADNILTVFIRNGKLFLENKESDYSEIYLEPKGNGKFQFEISKSEIVFTPGKATYYNNKNKKFIYKKL